MIESGTRLWTGAAPLEAERAVGETDDGGN